MPPGSRPRRELLGDARLRRGMPDDAGARTRAAARRRAARLRAVPSRSSVAPVEQLGEAGRDDVPDFVLRARPRPAPASRRRSASGFFRAISRKASRSRPCHSRSSFSKRSPVCGERRLDAALADARGSASEGSMSRTMVRSGWWPLSARSSSAADQLVVDAAGEALIGARRVMEAVGDDPLAALRASGAMSWLTWSSRAAANSTASAPGAPGFGPALEDEGADRLGLRRAAGLAGADRLDRATC